MLALDLNKVTKYYGEQKVLSDVTFQVKEGEFIGLLGHNGSGKTTLTELIVGLNQKTSGSIKVLGLDLDQKPLEARSYLGLVSQDFNFNQFDTVEQVIINQAGLYGIPRKEAIKRANEYMQILKIEDLKKEQTRFLSGGMKKRMMLARAVMHHPKILILDELSAGVDLEIRKLIWQFLQHLNQEQGTTILLITHYLDEIEYLCNRIVILDQGKLVDEGSVEELGNKLSSIELLVTVAESLSPDFLNKIPAAYCNEHTFALKLDLKKENYNSLMQRLSQLGLQVVYIKEKTSRLEQYFMQLRDQRDE